MKLVLYSQKTIEIIDVVGRTVERIITNETTHIFDLTGQASGIYTIRLITDAQQSAQKFILK